MGNISKNDSEGDRSIAAKILPLTLGSPAAFSATLLASRPQRTCSVPLVDVELNDGRRWPAFKKSTPIKPVFLFLNNASRARTIFSLWPVCIFSTLPSVHFIWYSQREVAQQSRASIVSDHFHHSHDRRFD